jgi:hypothetical protein
MVVQVGRLAPQDEPRHCAFGAHNLSIACHASTHSSWSGCCLSLQNTKAKPREFATDIPDYSQVDTTFTEDCILFQVRLRGETMSLFLSWRAGSCQFWRRIAAGDAAPS